MHAAGSARVRPVLTSLPLQILLYFGSWWSAIYWIITVIIFIWKGNVLPYPGNKFTAEFIIILIFVLIEPPRLFLGSKGNKTEEAQSLVACLLASGLTIGMYVYYVRYQTYVLKIEVLTNAIALAFTSLQVLLGALATARFAQAARYA